jgi:head-tail adaptor
MPGAGTLRERLTFQRRAVVPNVDGETLGDWRDVATVAARISPIAPRRGNPETVLAARLQGIVLYEVVVRSSTVLRTVTTDCRAIDVRRPGRAFNVRSIVNVDENDRFLTMLCEEGVADG